MGIAFRKEGSLSIDYTSLAKLRETCWLVLVGELHYSCCSTPANRLMHTHTSILNHVCFQSYLNLMFLYRLYVPLSSKPIQQCIKNNGLLSALISDQVH